MKNKQATGTARYDAATGKLTITTQAVRGKKTVPLVVVYQVEDLHPDTRVADPAYRLCKIVQCSECGNCGTTPDCVSCAFCNGKGGSVSESYDVHLGEHGPECSCPHAVYRGHDSRIPCKHVLALMAVGLMPKLVEYPGAKK
jgi:SWIM zinc finger